MALSQSTTHTKAAQAKNQAMLPEGAYVDLLQLQKLRHFAHIYKAAKRRANSADNSGQHQSRALNRGMEFEEVRLYQAGDDVRNIDWRVTARTQATHTKCYRDEKEKPVITLVDQRRSLFFGSKTCFKSVYACELAALINWSTIKRGDRAGGLVLGSSEIHETRPARSHSAVNQWLQLLSSSNNSIELNSSATEPSLYDSLQQLRRIARSGTECIIISDFYDLNEACEKELYLLARHNPVKLYWIIDPLEKELPLVGQITLSDGKQKTSVSIDKAKQQQHRQSFIEKQRYLSDLSVRLNVAFMEVETTTPLNDTIYGIRRG